MEFEVEGFDEEFEGISWFAREAGTGFAVHEGPVADKDLLWLVGAFEDLFDVINTSDHGAGVGVDAFGGGGTGGFDEFGAETDARGRLGEGFGDAGLPQAVAGLDSTVWKADGVKGDALESDREGVSTELSGGGVRERGDGDGS